MAAVFVVAAWLLGQRKLAIAGFLAGGIGYIMVEILKVVVDRPRPYALIVDAHQRTTDFLYNLGFPSGHTTNATVLSVICALMLRGKWRWLPFVWIPLVGVSRVYLGVHAPLDIVGGVALGLFITFGLYTVLSLLDKKLVIKP
jgi:membrane-associated phospholipid phosphatase